ncbi:MAG: hypothetical protein WAQ25_01665 [Candidatus Saccharimonas sp.]
MHNFVEPDVIYTAAPKSELEKEIEMGLYLTLPDDIDEAVWVIKNSRPSEFGAHLIESVASTVATLIKSGEAGDTVTHGNVHLLCLGSYGYVYVGEIKVTRAVYFGSDGKFYVEGPRTKRLVGTVIDIQPYSIKHASGWNGIRIDRLAEMLAACAI